MSQSRFTPVKGSQRVQCVASKISGVWKLRVIVPTTVTLRSYAAHAVKASKLNQQKALCPIYAIRKFREALWHAWNAKQINR